jgi:hypothetical protein
MDAEARPMEGKSFEPSQTKILVNVKMASYGVGTVSEEEILKS